MQGYLAQPTSRGLALACRKTSGPSSGAVKSPFRYYTNWRIVDHDKLGVCLATKQSSPVNKQVAPATAPPRHSHKHENSGSQSFTKQGSGSSRSEPQAQPKHTKLSMPAEFDRFAFQDFIQSDLTWKIPALFLLVICSRLGVYVRLPGVDVDGFAQLLQSSGLMSYVDTLSGGSSSKVGLFSLGVIPYVNASIMLQLLGAAFPQLKKLQREEGAQGRARFQYYLKLTTVVFAAIQAMGQLNYIRPFVEDWNPTWLAGSTCALVAGAMALVYIAEAITDLKLGNGTSVLVFVSIASSLPAGIWQLVLQGAGDDPVSAAMYASILFATTLGILHVQEAERRIPINYAPGPPHPSLSRVSYLPLKVNASGVMPLIFASSLLALPSVMAQWVDSPLLDQLTEAVGPGGPLYLPLTLAIIAGFNYYITLVQLEPEEMSDQLKRAGAAIPGIRPGQQTADYLKATLQRMSLLGSLFLGVLAAAPAAAEALTSFTALKGFGSTSALIAVGVASDMACRVRAEASMAKYGHPERLYGEGEGEGEVTEEQAGEQERGGGRKQAGM